MLKNIISNDFNYDIALVYLPFNNLINYKFQNKLEYNGELINAKYSCDLRDMVIREFFIENTNFINLFLIKINKYSLSFILDSNINISSKIHLGLQEKYKEPVDIFYLSFNENNLNNKIKSSGDIVKLIKYKNHYQIETNKKNYKNTIDTDFIKLCQKILSLSKNNNIHVIIDGIDDSISENILSNLGRLIGLNKKVKLVEIINMINTTPQLTIFYHLLIGYRKRIIF